MDLIEIRDIRKVAPIEREVPLEDLIILERLGYDVPTSLGTIRLRFIGALRRRTIELEIDAADPENAGKRQDLINVLGMLKDHPGDPGLISRQKFLEAYLEPSMYDHFAGCFISPQMRGGKSVMALASALYPSEWDNIRTLLLILIRNRPAGQVAAAMIQLCVRFGIKLSDSLTLENMTAQQMAILEDITKAEYDAIMGAVKQ